MDPQAVAALCHEHAQAEAELDIDRVLATLVPVPRYEILSSLHVNGGVGERRAFLP